MSGIKIKLELMTKGGALIMPSEEQRIKIERYAFELLFGDGHNTAAEYSAKKVFVYGAKDWTPEEQQRLVDLFQKNYTPQEIAKVLGNRTERAIYARLRKSGLIKKK